MVPSFIPASDRSLLVSFGDRISIDVHRRIVALTHALETDPITGVLNIHPAYCSVLLVFNPLETDHDAVQTGVADRLEPASNSPIGKSRIVEVPVCYGGEFGPDLEDLARERGLTNERVVALHSSTEYVAYFIGFVPGFAYLGGLPEQLAAPRLKTPRQRVPIGSVGIAGIQTGIYPLKHPAAGA